MLYDPKWEIQIKADPFSLDSLIAWLEKQPADKSYQFCDSSSCLIAQYLKAHGVKHFNLLSREIRELGWLEVVNPRVLGPRGDYFGFALDRARQLRAAISAGK